MKIRLLELRNGKNSIDLDQMQLLMPDKSKIEYVVDGNYLRCVSQPPMSEKRFEAFKQMQINLIGKENILEILTHDTGVSWNIYLDNSDKTKSVQINGKSFEISEEVFNLILATSKERDHYKGFDIQKVHAMSIKDVEEDK